MRSWIWKALHPSDRDEAKAAKIAAQIAQKKAQEDLYLAEKRDQRLREINKRNHFSEALTRAFREGLS